MTAPLPVKASFLPDDSIKARVKGNEKPFAYGTLCQGDAKMRQLPWRIATDGWFWAVQYGSSLEGLQRGAR